MNQETLCSNEWIGKNARQDYLDLITERPELFVQNELLMIETDIDKIIKYETENHVQIGVMYKSPYHLFVVDLVYDRFGRYFTYERCIPSVKKGAVVAVPLYKDCFVLLKQFRHAVRRFQYAFPRGFGEIGISSEENLKKEISEELGADILSFRKLGSVVSNSGLSSDKADVFCCEITRPTLKDGYESIVELEFLNRDELKQWISEEKIEDGFTLSALLLYLNSN